MGGVVKKKCPVFLVIFRDYLGLLQVTKTHFFLSCQFPAQIYSTIIPRYVVIFVLQMSSDKIIY